MSNFQTFASSSETSGIGSWYAVQTRSRHEKLVSYHFSNRAIPHYLPIVTEVHRWSDRRKNVEMPLFAGYVFVHVPPMNEERVRVLRTDGVVRFVGNSQQGTPIPDAEINAIRTLLEQKVDWVPQPFLNVGQRIRIRGGALDGVEGVFHSQNGEGMLVVSINAIQRSLSITIRGYKVEAI